MDFKLLIQSVKDACQNSPLMLVLGALAVAICIFLIVDAHRHKKTRARHRWK